MKPAWRIAADREIRFWRRMMWFWGIMVVFWAVVILAMLAGKN